MTAASSRRQAGFTLLELLVAIVIVGLLTATLYTSLYAAFRARRSVDEQLAASQSSWAAMNMIAQEIQSILPPTGVLAGPMVGADAIGPSGDADTLSFHNTASPRVEPVIAGDIQLVTIELDLEDTIDSDPASMGSPLVRRWSRQLLAPEAVEPNRQVIARNVQSLNFRYYDGLQWVDQWDSTQQDNGLPVAIEVTLRWGDGTNQNGAEQFRQITRVLRLPTAFVPEEVQIRSDAEGAGS